MPQLVIQGDDFGMCHAVNAAIVEAFTDGVLTQSSFMAPCPWADEALALARRASIAIGLHQTLTCDWDMLRWGPLTGGCTLVDGDGMFRATVAEAAAAVDEDEAAEEILAQAARVTDAGLRVDYLDVHMGMVCPPAYEHVAARLGVPFLYPGLDASLRFASIGTLSARPATEKKPWLIDRVRGLGPGVHLIVTHPGAAGPELASMASSTWPTYVWAEQHRTSDLATLVDPEVRAVIEDAGVELCTVAGARFE